MVTAILVILLSPIFLLMYLCLMAYESHTKRNQQEYEEARRRAAESKRREEKEFEEWGYIETK